jgi:hypothetical protein
MTPSINRLAESAKALGEYIIYSEFEVVIEGFFTSDVDSYEEYEEWVTKFQYYNAVVCAYGGQIDNIRVRLRDDYFEYLNPSSWMK